MRRGLDAILPQRLIRFNRGLSANAARPSGCSRLCSSRHGRRWFLHQHEAASLVSYATVDAYDEVEAGSHQRCARPGMKRWFLGVGLDSCFRFSYARSMTNLAKSVARKEFRLTPSANFLS